MKHTLQKIKEKWKALPLKWKIATAVLGAILILLISRSIIFTIIAWLAIVYFIIKVALDIEMS